MQNAQDSSNMLSANSLLLQNVCVLRVLLVQAVLKALKEVEGEQAALLEEAKKQLLRS